MIKRLIPGFRPIRGVLRVETPPLAAEVSAPVTFESFLRRLKPGVSLEDRRAAAWHLANKLGDRHSIGLHTKIVDAIVSGAYDGRRINRYFVKALDSDVDNRAGYFAKLIKPYPWAGAEH